MTKKRKRSLAGKLKRKWEALDFVVYWRSRLKNFDETFIFIVGGLICGILVGGMYGYSVKITPRHKRVSLLQNALSVKRSFAPTISVPGVQANNDYVFADFESAANFSIFETTGAHLEPDQLNGRKSEHAGRIQFFKGSRMSGIRMSEYFESKYAEHNWAGYRYLRLYAHNPGQKPLRFIIQFKDAWQKRYNERIELDGFQKKDLSLPLDKAAKEIDLRNIRQINIFIWDNEEEREIFIDDLRLTDPLS